MVTVETRAHPGPPHCGPTNAATTSASTPASRLGKGGAGTTLQAPPSRNGHCGHPVTSRPCGLRTSQQGSWVPPVSDLSSRMCMGLWVGSALWGSGQGTGAKPPPLVLPSLCPSSTSVGPFTLPCRASSFCCPISLASSLLLRGSYFPLSFLSTGQDRAPARAGQKDMSPWWGSRVGRKEGPGC